MSNKIETSFNIDKLEQGYLITKNNTERIGINNENDLENRINLANNIDDITNIDYQKELLNAVERKINLDII